MRSDMYDYEKQPPRIQARILQMLRSSYHGRAALHEYLEDAGLIKEGNPIAE